MRDFRGLANQMAASAVDDKQNGYDESRGRAFYRQLLDAARADAGIESATLAAHSPLGFLDTRAERVAIDGYEPRRDEDLAFMSNTVGSDYFRTLGINLTAGRAFEDRDDETGAPVAIVNHTLAERFWGGAANAIGKRVRVGDGGWRTVIGVAANVKYSRIDESPRPYVLFGVSATDATSFARALAVVLGGVIVATLVPAWRAARTNPLNALRHQ